MTGSVVRPWRLTLLVAGLSMFGPLSIDAILPAFPAMGAGLGADKLAMQQTISVYLISYALMSMVHGPLSDAMGRRRVLIGGLMMFVLASVGCALSASLGQLLAFRALQGLSAGVGMVVGRAVIRDTRHGDDAQRTLSQVSMIVAVAPAVAPIVGGWILGWGHWTLIFWCLAAFSMLLLVLTWLWLPETHPAQARERAGVARLLREYVAIFLNPRFQRLAAASAFNFAALFLFIASAPAYVLEILGLDEGQFGWFFVPMIGGFVLGAWVSGRLAGRSSGRRQATAGFVCSGIAVGGNVLYTLLVTEPAMPWAVLPAALNAFGIALVNPIATLAILDMYPRLRGSASSLLAFTGLALNAVVAGALSPLVSHDALVMALAAAGLVCLGCGFWVREMRCPQPGAGLQG